MSTVLNKFGTQRGAAEFEDHSTQVATAPFVKLGYRPALDGLRGIAVLMVMLDHAGSYVWQSELLSGGGLGVDIFFVLSGFLITAILLEEWSATNRVSLKRFYLRRALRLIPALTAVLLVCTAYALYCVIRSRNLAAGSGILKSVLFTLLYIPNLATVYGWTNNNLLGHTWSLGIEEQFYFVWPILLIFLLKLRLNLRRIVLIVTVGVILVVLNRIILLRAGVSTEILYLRPDTRADSLLVGCVAAILWHIGAIGRIRWSGYFWPGVGTIAILTVLRPLLLYALPLVLYAVLAVSTAVVILGLIVRGRASKLCNFPPLVYTGRISYGLYLWHLPVYSLAVPLLFRWGVPPVIVVVMLFTLVFLISMLSFRFIEQPFLRLKRKMSPKN